MKPEKFEPFTIKNSTFDLKKIEFSEILKEKTPIIFDTNFLFTTFQFKIDVIAEIKKLVGNNFALYIYEGTIGELESVERKKDKNKHFLPLIVKMLHLYDFKIINSSQTYIDDQIMGNANNDVIVATNDKELRQRLWSVPCRVMYLRQKAYLEIK